MKLKPAKNPQCVRPEDKFLVVERDNNEIIESHSTLVQAQTAVQWLTEHERKNKRSTEYYVKEIK